MVEGGLVSTRSPMTKPPLFPFTQKGKKNQTREQEMPGDNNIHEEEVMRGKGSCKLQVTRCKIEVRAVGKNKI
jgi:hypothetical protein